MADSAEGDRMVAAALTSAGDEAERVEWLCEVLHDAYEAAAVRAGWETQERSRKPWADVPEANKATMRASVRAVRAAVLREAADDPSLRLRGHSGVSIRRLRDRAAQARRQSKTSE